MSPETRAKIFKAFYTTKGIAGTGLGLWLSREIVDRHHGQLLVRSRMTPGSSGTVFELFLPYQTMVN
jgi:two-component system, sporulation sensor kinase C